MIRQEDLDKFRIDATVELKELLNWWVTYMPDEKNGGFFASVDNFNNPDFAGAKGIVLNSRICWAFSAAFLHTRDEAYLKMAHRAYQYIQENFFDNDFGGVFWSVSPEGKMLDGKKQVYGIAFTIYAFSEYYKATGNDDALNLAKVLYGHIEMYTYDSLHFGYVEAMTREWTEIGDLRLSEKDLNEKKSMNTHLHIVEAYANLFSVWKNDGLRNKIISLLNVFEQHIINPVTHHLKLFFDIDWSLRSSLISYGHDIEASWLLLECAKIVEDEKMVELYSKRAIDLIIAADKGWDEAEGGLWYEFDPIEKNWIYEKHWWPQAEAMVGYINAFNLTQNDKYFLRARKAFDMVLSKLKDNVHGEWIWGIDAFGSRIKKEKAGFWKCPYHSIRACIEVINRI